MKTLIDLEDTDCRWPIGDPKKADFGYCGASRTSKSYCCKHKAMAYQPARGAPYVPGVNKSGAETTRGSFHGFGVHDKEPPQQDCVDAFAAGVS